MRYTIDGLMELVGDYGEARAEAVIANRGSTEEASHAGKKSITAFKAVLVYAKRLAAQPAQHEQPYLEMGADAV